MPALQSVFLRTVGLLPVLAQAGSFVPADKLVMGIVDQVFTRIHSLETAAVGMSSFSIDVTAVSARGIAALVCESAFAHSPHVPRVLLHAAPFSPHLHLRRPRPHRRRLCRADRRHVPPRDAVLTAAHR